jgi:Flp pilus assembly protein TadG
MLPEAYQRTREQQIPVPIHHALRPSGPAASQHDRPVARRKRARRRHRGQSMAEFALILTPLMVVLLGIMQMGFVMNAYVTLSNAAREGARSASVYLYDRTLDKATNDANRLTVARSTIDSSMGLLKNTAPQFASSDMVLSYSLPSGVSENDPRTGQYVTIRLTYHLDLMIPLISSFMPKDSGGRLPMTSEVTMVIN